MTNAETTRRAIVAGLATAPAVALPAVALPAVAGDNDRTLVDLVKQLDGWQARMTAALDRFNATERLYWDAQRALKPAISDEDRAAFKELPDSATRWSEKLLTFARADTRLSSASCEQMARSWTRLGEVAEALKHAEAQDARISEDTGHTAAEKATDYLWDEWNERFAQVCEKRATSLSGLQAKAKLARRVVDSGDYQEMEELLESIASDLLAMQTV